MRLGLTEVEWGYIGAKLAQGSDTDQVEFFKAFVKECKTWGTSYQVGMQLAGVNQGLTAEERKVLAMIGYEEK